MGEDQSTGAEQVPPPAARLSLLWGFAALAIGSGLLLSWWNVLDRNWLARAGCVVVVLGVWSGVGGLIEERFLLRSYALRRRMLIARIRRRYRRDAESREQAIEEADQRLQLWLERRRGQHRLRVGVREATLLVGGTLLWGFGDLLRFLF